MQSMKSRASQRGTVVVLLAISLGVLLLTAGLALDMGHAFLNKTRLQNSVDAAALAAAKTLDDTGNTVLATAEAIQAFGFNAAAAGNGEMARAYGGNNGIQVTVEYSATLPPFAPGAANGPYVRVRAVGFVLPAWLVQVGGVFEKEVAAAAVAGPRTLNSGSTVCNIAPMMVCGNPAAGAPGQFGYALNSPVVLKKASQGGQAPVGPGNFQLIRLNGNGASVVRENLAGSYEACIAGGSSVETQPGNEAGPVAQGLNTRFGQYTGPMRSSDYPPDVIVDSQSPALNAVQNASGGYDVYQNGTRITDANVGQLYDYQDYLRDLQNPASYDYQPLNEGGQGAFDRRVVAVPVVDCTTMINGQGTASLLGFACFFLLQPAEQSGTDSFVYGQFVEGCNVNGTPGPNPVAGAGPHIIQLYDDPASNDS